MEHGTEIEFLALGSSQVKDAVNPAQLRTTAINMASGDQHHDTDFKLYTSVSKRLPGLKTVLIEVSYSHLELPHNGRNFWKNSIYLNYYKVNCFERSSWFKDRLIFLSNPQFYSSQLVSKFITHEFKNGFNRYGFDTLNFEGRFKRLEFDEARIAKTNFKINKKPNKELFVNNSGYLWDMIETFSDDGIKVIIAKVPMYKTFLTARNPEILRRRDSMLETIETHFSNVYIFDLEEDTLNFKVEHYINQSHLNPKGAAIYSAMLQHKLDSLN
jgi:hypothetical protein